MDDKIKKILDEIEPLIIKFDRITRKSHSLITAENIQRIRNEARTDTVKQIEVILEEITKNLKIENGAEEIYFNGFLDAIRMVTAKLREIM